MNYIIEAERTVPIKDSFDTVVCGGGIAGISAALSAARCGSHVLLIENQFMLGGLGTAGLVTIFLPLCDGEGHQVSFGICEELIKLSVSMGAERKIPDSWTNKTGSTSERAKNRYQCRYNPQVFAILAEELLLSEKVSILYGTKVCGVIKEKDKITHVIVENKSGRLAYGTKNVIDATGDADICKFADAPTAVFKQGNSLASWYYYTDSGKTDLNSLGFCDVPDENGKYAQSETNSLSKKRYIGLDGTELSEMVIASHAALINDFKMRGNSVSCENSVSTIATIPQVRMTRRIDGEYTIDESENGKYCASSVGMIADWRKKGKVYELPYETLYSKRIKNLICAGRCISVTDSMWDITRVIPVCAVTGEAAGISASLTDDFGALPAEKIQKVLKERKVPLHTEEVL